MQLHISTFSTHKRGLSAGEYEDASWCGREHTEQGDWAGPVFRAAVSDGASEALLAGRWARLLTKSFATAPSHWALYPCLDRAVRAWPEVVARYVEDREARSKPIQWFEEPGLERGSYATILGCRIDDRAGGNEGAFDTWALGDSCIFQVRDDRLDLAFPMQTSSDFNFSPALVPSKGGDPDLLRKRQAHHRGDWRSGDTFYLATDAVAHWIISEAEACRHPWRLLADLDTSDGPQTFEDWIERQRDDGSMHNDDCTIVRIDVY